MQAHTQTTQPHKAPHTHPASPTHPTRCLTHRRAHASMRRSTCALRSSTQDTSAYASMDTLTPSRRHTGLGLAAGLALQVAAPFSAQSAESPQDWLAQDTRQNLHIVSCVGDRDATIKFYEERFSMQLIRSREFPDGSSNAFMGYGAEVEGNKIGHCVMELVSKPGVSSYRIRSGFQSFGILSGGRQPVNNIVKDPTGYPFKIIPTGSDRVSEPFARVSLQVSDLGRSVKYYTDVLGMKLLRSEDQDGKQSAIVGYGPEFQSTVFELVASGKPEVSIDRGDGYQQMAISTKDVYKTSDQIKAAGGTIVREAGPVPGIGTKIVATVDPDGWRYALVDMSDFLKEFV